MFQLTKISCTEGKKTKESRKRRIYVPYVIRQEMCSASEAGTLLCTADVKTVDPQTHACRGGTKLLVQLCHCIMRTIPIWALCMWITEYKSLAIVRIARGCGRTVY